MCVLTKYRAFKKQHSSLRVLYLGMVDMNKISYITNASRYV